MYVYIYNTTQIDKGLPRKIAALHMGVTLTVLPQKCMDMFFTQSMFRCVTDSNCKVSQQQYITSQIKQGIHYIEENDLADISKQRYFGT